MWLNFHFKNLQYVWDMLIRTDMLILKVIIRKLCCFTLNHRGIEEEVWILGGGGAGGGGGGC